MASKRQIAANRRNAAKSSGPRTQQGKARSRRNALRHGLSATLIDSTSVPRTINSDLDAADADLIAAHQRLRQIEAERVKILAGVGGSSNSPADALCTALKRIAAIERYSRQSYSKLKKQIARPSLKQPATETACKKPG